MQKRLIDIDEIKTDLMNRAIDSINLDNERHATFLIQVAAVLEDIWVTEVFERADAKCEKGVERDDVGNTAN